MEGIKKFITLNVPVGACNFRCSYCYLSHRGNGAYHGGIRPFVREPRFIADFFSREKMGGTCYFNLCADGETSFHPQIAELIKLLLAEGHVADIITNGTNSAFFDGMISVLSAEEKKRFFVKFSFHYVQLLQKNLLETFSANVQKIKKSGISFSVEITPHDELIPFISEIKEFSLKEFGALPHITVARNDGTKQLELLSEYKKDDLKKIWGGFNSGLFDFKIGIFNERRREFCYAGLWSLAGSLETGDLFQCYIGEKIGNISDGKICFKPVCRCLEPHCFNGHAFLTLGVCPEFSCPTYAQMRDRICTDGTHFLSDELQEFFSGKLCQQNEELSEKEKNRLEAAWRIKKIVRNLAKPKNFAIRAVRKILREMKRILNGGGGKRIVPATVRTKVIRGRILTPKIFPKSRKYFIFRSTTQSNA